MLGIVFNHTVIARFQLVAELHILDVMDNLLLSAKYCIKIMKAYTLYHHYNNII